MMCSLITNTCKAGVMRVRIASCRMTVFTRGRQTAAGDNKHRDSTTPSVAEYYRNKNVFITGGTGFMGKTIIEKLLRSCPDVGHIYMLVRGKNGKDPNQRLTEYLSNPIFDRVKEGNSSLLKKVQAIQGDIVESKLGMKDSDRQMLKENVHIFLNAAATVKFVEPIRSACETLVSGQMRAMDLAESMERLEAFIHVSSFGVAITTVNNYALAGLLPISIKAPDLLELVRKTDDVELKKMQSGDLLSHAKPFTYFFCKAITEHELSARAEKKAIPFAIVRPSWIEPPAREPIPGWMDNHSTFLLTDLIVAAGNGSLRAMHVDPESESQMIPGDAVANLTIACAWDLKYHPQHDKQWAHVYNMSSCGIHKCSLETIERSVYRMYSTNPSKNAIGPVPKKWLYKSWPVYQYHNITKLLVPAIMKILFSGSPRRAIEQAKERVVTVASGNFVLPLAAALSGDLSNWLSLIDRLSKEDREIFWMDIRGLDWDKYCDDMILGLRKYYLGEI